MLIRDVILYIAFDFRFLVMGSTAVYYFARWLLAVVGSLHEWTLALRRRRRHYLLLERAHPCHLDACILLKADHFLFALDDAMIWDGWHRLLLQHLWAVDIYRADALEQPRCALLYRSTIHILLASWSSDGVSVVGVGVDGFSLHKWISQVQFRHTNAAHLKFILARWRRRDFLRDDSAA